MNTKLCNVCSQDLPVGSFSKNKSSKDGLQASCRQCQSDRWARYKAEKGDQIRKHQRDKSKDPEYSEVLYRRRSTPEARAKNRAYMVEYRRKNRAKLYEYELRYAARRRENGGEFTEDDWLTLLAKYGNKCIACGSKDRLSADHVIPVSKGGANGIENRQPLCKSCNSRKSAGCTDFRKP